MCFVLRYLKTRVKILVDGTLLIPSLVPEDTGNYTCIPTNGLMTSPSASAHLKVKRRNCGWLLLCMPWFPGLCVSFHLWESDLLYLLPLSLLDPARVGRMPRETYLPTGMGGVIFCPVQAEPPMIFVNWTKDGNNLNLDNVGNQGNMNPITQYIHH